MKGAIAWKSNQLLHANPTFIISDGEAVTLSHQIQTGHASTGLTHVTVGIWDCLYLSRSSATT